MGICCRLEEPKTAGKPAQTRRTEPYGLGFGSLSWLWPQPFTPHHSSKKFGKSWMIFFTKQVHNR